MNTHLITAEDHTLFLNCLESILTSEKEYTVLLTNKRGKYVAQYLENTPGKDIKLISSAESQEKLEFLGNKNPITEDTNNVIQYAANGKDKVTINTKENVNLTQREVEVITLVAKEFTTQEIADKLFLSKHTIESYRKNLISKLNVRNLAGLTKYALKMQYINLDTAL